MRSRHSLPALALYVVSPTMRAASIAATRSRAWLWHAVDSYASRSVAQQGATESHQIFAKRAAKSRSDTSSARLPELEHALPNRVNKSARPPARALDLPSCSRIFPRV